MEEELIPPELLVSPEMFESLFGGSLTNLNLAQIAMEGNLFSIKNRFIAWRVFLGFFPSTGPLELWVERATELRNRYKSLVESHTV